MTAYLISDVRVLDEDAFAQYAARVPAVLAAHGVEYVVRGGEPNDLEGEWGARRIVVLRFRDRDHVQSWYHSEGYQQLVALRAQSAEIRAVVVDGLESEVGPSIPAEEMMNGEPSSPESYVRASFGGQLRRGGRPAVLVVDFTLGFTDPSSSFGADMTAEVSATRRVLDAARERGHLVIFTTVGYHPTYKDAGVALQKAPKGTELVAGGPSSILDPRLGRRDDEIVVLKRAPSALFGTSVPAVLMAHAIDTVVLCGAVTSGCIRATCVDLYSYGLPTLVPRDCVGDRAVAPHEANLFDMQAKYADVVTSGDAISYLEAAGLTEANSSPVRRRRARSLWAIRARSSAQRRGRLPTWKR